MCSVSDAAADDQLRACPSGAAMHRIALAQMAQRKQVCAAHGLPYGGCPSSTPALQQLCERLFGFFKRCQDPMRLALGCTAYMVLSQCRPNAGLSM